MSYKNLPNNEFWNRSRTFTQENFPCKMPVMAYNQTSWREGQPSANPNGRPHGARNKHTQLVIQQIKDAGHKDPLLTLSELQANSDDEGIRATAANMLAPYLHSKLASTPVPPPPQYIAEAISLPKPTTVRLAAENINRLSEMKAQGLLDFATADSLIADNRIILNALIDEQKLLVAQGGSPEQIIRIEGGLPALPGTDIIMPEPMNGHATSPGELSSGDPPTEASDPPPSDPT